MLKRIGQYAFKHKKQTMLIIMICMFASSGFDYARGDTGTANAVLTSSGIFFATYIVGGVAWSLTGYINNIRNHANYLLAHPGNSPPDPQWSGFDPAAMRDDVFIGMILGGAAFITTAVANIPVIDSLPTFLAAVQSAIGLIVVTDKVGVGAILNR